MFLLRRTEINLKLFLLGQLTFHLKFISFPEIFERTILNAWQNPRFSLNKFHFNFIEVFLCSIM